MHRKKILRLWVWVFAMLLLTGCWDRVELESRGFVVSLGVDKGADEENKRYSVAMALPDVSALADKQGLDKEGKSVKKAEDVTLSAAMRQVDAYSSQKFYYGHTKVCIFSGSILEDEKLFKEALDALERNREISRKTLILATDGSAAKVLEAKAPGEPMVGMYVSNFYKNNKGTAATAFRHDLGDLISELGHSGNTVLPKIQTEKEEVKMGGAAVIKDYRLAGWLDDKQTRGYLWVKGTGVGTQVIAEAFGTSIPLQINAMSSQVIFTPGTPLSATVQVQVKGIVEEFIFGDEALHERQNIQDLKALYEQVIQQEIKATAEIFQSKMKLDGFGFQETLRKQNYDLYLTTQEDWPAVFEQMRIEPIVTVKITNTGAVK